MLHLHNSKGSFFFSSFLYSGWIKSHLLTSISDWTFLQILKVCKISKKVIDNSRHSLVAFICKLSVFWAVNKGKLVTDHSQSHSPHSGPLLCTPHCGHPLAPRQVCWECVLPRLPSDGERLLRTSLSVGQAAHCQWFASPTHKAKAASKHMFSGTMKEHKYVGEGHFHLSRF